jgi:hypothetical protein
MPGTEEAVRAEELRQFFCISSEMLEPTISDEALQNCLDELEAIRMHTPSRSLRLQCNNLIRRFDPAKTHDKFA